MLRRSGIVIPQPPAGAWMRLGIFLDAGERGVQSSADVGLLTNPKAPRASPCCRVLVEGDDLHRDVTSRRILLQMGSTRSSPACRQEDIQRHRGGWELAGKIESFGAARGDEDF